VDTVLLDTGLRRTDAPSGLVVLSEAMPSVRSAALGIFVRTASAHEPRGKMGVSHLLEHMVFKGTERRTAKQLALELEVRGGAPSPAGTTLATRRTSWTTTCRSRSTSSPTWSGGRCSRSAISCPSAT
jgi:predicted Zn-dependent peptidase